MKMGLSVAMLLFTGVSTIGVASGAGYRIAAVCAAVLCGIGGIVFAFYNERKVLIVLMAEAGSQNSQIQRDPKNVLYLRVLRAAPNGPPIR